MIEFSVVISTCNRAGILGCAVTSVLKQAGSSIEVIVSDDASNDNTEEVVRGFGDSRIIYLRNEKTLGLSAARNLAMSRAAGEYVIFMDDDSSLKEDFFERLRAIIKEYGLSVLCPKIVSPETGEPFAEFSADSGNKYLGYFDFNHFRGGSHILSRKVIEKNGYYDERFGIGAKYGAAEESDYFFRLKSKGEKVLYCPELVIYHKIDYDPEPSKVFSYSYGISAMLAKQITRDPAHIYFYLPIFARRLAVSLIRTLQHTFFPASIEAKNRMYKYKYFFKGTVKGFIDYLRLG